MTIIFLDIDGVLCIDFRTYHDINKQCYELFMGFLRKHPDCKVVISSTWRKQGKESFIEYFTNNGCDELLHHLHEDWCTPDAWFQYCYIEGQKNRKVIRGDDIDLWLKAHPEIDHYICIDDDSDFHPHHALFKTSGKIGITQDTITGMEILVAARSRV